MTNHASELFSVGRIGELKRRGEPLLDLVERWYRQLPACLDQERDSNQEPERLMGDSFLNDAESRRCQRRKGDTRHLACQGTLRRSLSLCREVRRHELAMRSRDDLRRPVAG